MSTCGSWSGAEKGWTCVVAFSSAGLASSVAEVACTCCDFNCESRVPSLLLWVGAFESEVSRPAAATARPRRRAGSVLSVSIEAELGRD